MAVTHPFLYSSMPASVVFSECPFSCRTLVSYPQTEQNGVGLAICATNIFFGLGRRKFPIVNFTHDVMYSTRSDVLRRA